MRQVLLKASGEIEVLEVPIPPRRVGTVLVRNAYSTISAGTEGASVSSRRGLMAFAEKCLRSRDRLSDVWQLVQTTGLRATWDSVRSKLAGYSALGYSCAGYVVETADEGAPYKVGDRVACMGAQYASHAEYVAVPYNLTARVPDGVDLREASLSALACIALQGVRRLDATPGETVVVIGLGLIGQLTCQLLNALGYKALGMDIRPGRARDAKRYGAFDAWNSAEVDSVKRVMAITEGIGADGVVICAATKARGILDLASDLCRKRGRVSVVGDVGMDADRSKMYQKELEVRLSCSYGPGRYDRSYEEGGNDYPIGFCRWTEKRNLELYLDLLARRRLRVGELPHELLSVERAVDAYAAIKKPGRGSYIVQFDYGTDVPSAEELQAGRKVNVLSAAPRAEGRVTLGIIGLGSFASAVHVPTLARLSDAFWIKTLVELDSARATVGAKRLGAAHIASDLGAVLDDSDIEAIMIFTRHAAHGPLALQALQAGKHVFVEKPMATDLSIARRIGELSAERGLLVQTGFNRRFAPYYVAMKKAFERLPRPLALTCRVSVGPVSDTDWSNTVEEGGRFLGDGCHMFDLFNWFLNEEPEFISAQSAGDANTVNPNVISTVRYPSGSVAVLNYCALGHVAMEKEHLEVFGGGQSARCVNFRRLEAWPRRLSAVRAARGKKGHAAELEAFACAVRGKPFPVKVPDARAGELATWMAQASIVSAGEQRSIPCIEPLETFGKTLTDS